MMNMTSKLLFFVTLSSCSSAQDARSVYYSAQDDSYILVDSDGDDFFSAGSLIDIATGNVEFRSKVTIFSRNGYSYEPHLNVYWPEDSSAKAWGDNNISCISDNVLKSKNVSIIVCKDIYRNVKYSFSYKNGVGLRSFSSQCEHGDGLCEYNLYSKYGFVFPN